MVRMIDLIKKSGGGDEEPDRKQRETLPDSLPEKGPLRFPSAEDFARAGAPAAPAARRAAPAAPSRERGSLLQGDLEESRGGGLSTPKNLGVKQRYCPYLGGKAKRESLQDYPAASNVCYAQESQERKLLRTYTLPYAAISAQRQREFCLSSSYARCPVYQAKEKASAKA
ncbi:MAG: hypothetical protein HYZ11_13205 [Candidatus Tectomicrobia bacterium]|uniref:Uncharacterized protein n=1 Tax=Tectimicrobiota bacterium TaxID=2528274 RepID=A0A932I3A9_UNCTE|nr:hypothetical protein [Candidatus Tectomicrobia bacterium]